MGIWSRLLRWRAGSVAEAPAEESEAEAATDPDEPVVTLPAEPFVFECRSCGKVFDARRKRPQCPECDSPDVTLMSE